jgi:hypothetical protein
VSQQRLLGTEHQIRNRVLGSVAVEFPALLDHRLIIQTIRRDRSGSVWIDDASNVSRPDPSGADQIDAHQATDLAVLGFESLAARHHHRSSAAL